jgi:hypothetical protein
MPLTVKKVRIAEIQAPAPGNGGPPTTPFAALPCFPR